MATVNCGILDGFYGKVGTVVGSFWKGIPVMRAYVRRQHDAKSETQVVIRARFKAMMELVSGFLDASRIGLHDTAVSGPMTEGNMFVLLNKRHFRLVDGLLDIDYAHLLLGHSRECPYYRHEDEYQIVRHQM